MSTSIALLSLTEEISRSMDNKNFTVGVFIDLAKAFDTVNHRILLDKLKHAVRDLGVMPDSNMTMSPHVLRVCQNCYFQIRLIRRLEKSIKKGMSMADCSVFFVN